MIYDLTHRIEVATPQKATAVREKCAAYIEEDKDAELILTSQARSIPSWKVIGVDVQTKQPFKEDVEAESEDEAKVQVEGPSKSKGSKVVAEVRRA